MRNKRLKLFYMTGVISVLSIVGFSPALFENIHGQDAAQRRGQGRRPELPPTLGLEQGLIEFETPDFILKLVKASQTAAALQPKGADGFDFTPSDRLEIRAANGFYHLGDLTLRLRQEGYREWKEYSTASERKPVHPLETSEGVLAAADLAPTLPPDCPLRVFRAWEIKNGCLVLKFTLTNITNQALNIGALGIPMIFNNILTGRSLEQAHAVCSFFDPYIGQDAGYLQVTRLSGQGPALVVVPGEKTPFEGFRPLSEPMRLRQTFEGSLEWTVHSQAYVENEWKNADPWNPPSKATILPGDKITYSLRFLLSPGIRQIEATLLKGGRPVAVGIPGYILPMDLEGRLFLNYAGEIESMEVEPEGAINIERMHDTQGGWKALRLKGKKWGRARLTLVYSDGLMQSIHYYVIKPSFQVVDNLGNFLMTKQWFTGQDEPFLRAPSVMSYDREADSIVLQDSRVWIAGLGDEGGSGSWVAAVMKQLGRPQKEEIFKIEQFIDKVLWGRIQYAEGPHKYGVRKSLFYYQPDELPPGYYEKSFDWSTWTSWDKKGAEIVNRSYNYPHAAAAYWTFYRLARNFTGLITVHDWEWYLERAFQTGLAMGKFAPQHAQHGQMEGTVFLKILEDMKRENWAEKADSLEKAMKQRADIWKAKAYPFGSEMAWDSTGQEEVYAWCKYFGYQDKALVSLNSILGYMPTLPHWGYNGNARRYWDFLYGGKWRRIERQLHHYGSGLNAIPVLNEYRENPSDHYLLRVGYGGMMGALTNIDEEGFASAAFHSYPSALVWDPYSGDYGPNFFGHALNTGTYVIKHDEFGWLAFGGNLEIENEVIRVKPLDSFRSRIYVAPLGLWLTLDAGRFSGIEINQDLTALRLGFEPAAAFADNARLRMEQPAVVHGIGRFVPQGDWQIEREAFVIPLTPRVKWIRLVKQ